MHDFSLMVSFSKIHFYSISGLHISTLKPLSIFISSSNTSSNIQIFAKIIPHNTICTHILSLSIYIFNDIFRSSSLIHIKEAIVGEQYCFIFRWNFFWKFTLRVSVPNPRRSSLLFTYSIKIIKIFLLHFSNKFKHQYMKCLFHKLHPTSQLPQSP